MKKKRHKTISKEEALLRLARYCAYQDRCHQEVRSKLLDLGIYGMDLEEIIVELITDDFLNEERFARSYARGKFRIKRWGRIRIRQELKQRQISDYCIKKAMQEIEDADYLQCLTELLHNKKALLNESNPFILRNKLAQYAIRKGFESKLIWDILKQQDFTKDDSPS
ncbi:MAG: regulatory protein RecX [Bacteroidota bacterium]